MIDELLLALDGTEQSVRSIEPVLALARLLGAAVSAVSVDEPNVEPFGDLVWLERHVAPVDLEVRRSFVLTATDAATALADLAAAEPATLLCMSSHGRTNLGELVLGSVSADVVRRSSRPVLVLGPQCEPPTALGVVEVLVPPDAPEGGPVRAEATAWAAALGTTCREVAEADDLSPLAVLAVMAATPSPLPGHPLGSAGAVIRHARQPVLVLGPAAVGGVR